MLNTTARSAVEAIFTPLARPLARAGVSPDAVTIAGTAVLTAASLGLFGTGHLLVGTVVIALSAFADNLDGVLARMTGRSGPWGSFLDSALDRVGDAALFTGLVIWYTGGGGDRAVALLAATCLGLSLVVSYTRAKAEALGATASVGVAERAERLVAVLVGTFLVGLGAPSWVLGVILALLAVATAVTVVQRLVVVRAQLHVPAPRGDRGGPLAGGAPETGRPARRRAARG